VQAQRTRHRADFRQELRLAKEVLCIVERLLGSSHENVQRHLIRLRRFLGCAFPFYIVHRCSNVFLPKILQPKQAFARQNQE
jgi:hypothetical protein